MLKKASNARRRRRQANSLGAQWEFEVFGCEAGQFYPVAAENNMTISEALNHVAQRQYYYDWDVNNPPTVMGKRLFEAVKQHLLPRDAADLKFYCATGSILDRKFGTDGFFRVRNHVVLVDVTTDSLKPWKTAVIFYKANGTSERIIATGKLIADLLMKSIAKETN